MSDVPTASQTRLHAETTWTRFGPHRDRVQSLVMNSVRESGVDTPSLCILGAGALNDVRLGELVERFSKVHLVDLDPEAVRSGLRHQGMLEQQRWVLHPATDLSGVLAHLTPSCPPGAALADRIPRQRLTLPGNPFDVTLSAGVLSQLLQCVVGSQLPPEEIAPLCLAVRNKHLRDLVALARPGGTLILVTDIVSTATAPHLHALEESDLGLEMVRLVAAGNVFAGANPYRIMAVLQTDDDLSDKVTRIRLVGPWLWAVRTDRTYLTCAIVARRV